MTLRQLLRKRRRQLPLDYRQNALVHIIQRVNALPSVIQAQHIAGYICFDGEVDPEPILSNALKQGKKVSLPRVHHDPQHNIMTFHEITQTSILQKNHFGIDEPDREMEVIVDPHSFDVVLVPVVGFDSKAHRMGMGKGYYDAYFSFVLKRTPTQKKPVLIGLAFDCQRCDDLWQHPADVPLDMIVTESQIIHARNEG